MRLLFNVLFMPGYLRCRWRRLLFLIVLVPYSSVYAAGSTASPSITSNRSVTGASSLVAGSQSLKPWSIQPSVQTTELYVTRSGANPYGQEGRYMVTEVNPQLAISGKSPRATLDLKYRMQNIFYATHASADHTYHQLRAKGQVTLLRKLLFVDASSYMSQQIISPTQQIYLGNFAVTGNRTNVRTYSISPYIHYNIGTAATAVIRYQRQRLMYGKLAHYNNTSNIYSARISNSSKFDRLAWGVSYTRERVAYDAYQSVSFENAQGQLGWRLSRTFMLQGTIGYDNNQYRSSAGKTRGKRWSIGFSWSPGIRTSLTAMYGRRYFGNTYSLSFKHRARFTTWQARYSVRAMTVRALQSTSQLIGLINPSGQVTLVNFLVPTITQQVLITKRGTLSVSRRFKEGQMNFSAYDARRQYQLSGINERYYGSLDSISRKLGRRSHVSLTGAWTRYDLQSGVRYDYWYAGLAFSRQFSRNVTGGVQFRHVAQQYGNSGNGYSENIVSASINVKL